MPNKELNKSELFLELAKPDENGVSRWVSVDEFVGKYVKLVFGNGADWARKESVLARKYNIEFDKSITNGPRIDRIRLNGFNTENIGSQTISSEIKEKIKKEKCVILNTSHPEVDHKNGRKNDERVLNTETQTINDFQPLSKAANDAKRQHCKDCVKSGNRFDATVLGYNVGWTSGGIKHDGSITGCVGCYWYDPIDFNFKASKINKELENENKKLKLKIDELKKIIENFKNKRMR